MKIQIEVHQPIPSVSELPEDAELVVNEEKVIVVNEEKVIVVNEEKVIESPIVEIIDHENSTVKTEQLVESPKLESSEGGGR